jgi:phosphotransferase system IIA component
MFFITETLLAIILIKMKNPLIFLHIGIMTANFQQSNIKMILNPEKNPLIFLHFILGNKIYLFIL